METTSPADLDARIKRIYDHLYANASVRTPAAIAAEVGKLLRTATHLERGAGLFPAFTLSPEVRRGLGSNDAKRTKSFARDVRAAYEVMNRDWKLYDREGLLLSDHDLAWCCAQLDGVVVSAGKRDVFGDAVEIFRTSWAKQSSGQFFTDGRVTHLAVAMLRFDPLSGDDLIDICCGTGGFLLAGLDRIRSQVGEEAKIAELGSRALRGQEVDPEICEVANASLLCRLGSKKSVVHRGNSLAPTSFTPDDPNGLHEGTHRCAASNPPFGTKITVKDPEILRHYDLALGSDGRKASARAPDILLLERNIKMLQPGVGRLAIVIPYQILSGPQTRYIREWLLRQAHLEAVVDLPAETFQPHTGTKTSLLVVRRRKRPLPAPPAKEQERVFMATPQWIGHDRRGQPVYRRAPDGRTSGTVLSDIEDVGRAFEAYLKEEDPSQVHGESFSIPVHDVLADPDLRMNARYYRDVDSAADSRALPRGWKKVRLADACERIFFPTRFKRNYVEPSANAVPFLGGANITELLADTDKWISRDDPRFEELVVREGWVLITRSGSTGIVSTVPRAWDGVAMSEHVIRIVPREDVLSPAWLQTYLRSSIGQRALERGIFGSVIDEITPEFVGQLEVPVPKDPKMYEAIARRVTEAERSREHAIRGFRDAVVELEELLRP
ncbi:MAG TPA: N-6 DNA methylase [Myxococcaceae bacterium]|nr:N-6 DNA methylase [Myxococcaceae bacterium]